MDFEQARFNMVHQQVRPWEVTSSALIDAMLSIPREQFVPQSQQTLCYLDEHLPFSDTQFLLSPSISARLIQALNLTKAASVLEIGPGSGYITTLLATLAKRVTVIDTDAQHLSQVIHEARELNRFNVVAKCVPTPAEGYLDDAPYDAIFINGSLGHLPPSLRLQLNDGGRIAAVVGSAPSMQALQITRKAQHEWQTTLLFETYLPRLNKQEVKPSFEF